MSITVDPAQLEGYATQIERNAELFRSPFRAYCMAHCGHTDGMTGLLALARPAVALARDSSARLFDSGERELFQVAVNLRAASTAYRVGDADAAERIWLTVPRDHAPQGYVEGDDARHPADFRDPFVPALTPPRPRDEMAEAVVEARQHLGVIDNWLDRFAHFTLSADVLPQIVGDWGTLRVNADGYAALAGREGVQVLRANLAYGMDSLSASWDSAAATQFAYTIRDRWLPAVDALQHFLQMHSEAFEWLAQEAETTLTAIVLALDFLKFWIVEKALRILRLAGSLLGLGAVWVEIVELVSGVLTVWHEVTALFELLKLAFQGTVRRVEFAAAEVRVIDDLWLAPGGNRFDPLTVG